MQNGTDYTLDWNRGTAPVIPDVALRVATICTPDGRRDGIVSVFERDAGLYSVNGTVGDGSAMRPDVDGGGGGGVWTESADGPEEAVERYLEPLDDLPLYAPLSRDERVTHASDVPDSRDRSILRVIANYLGFGKGGRRRAQ